MDMESTNNRTSRKKAGFTLIELMVVIVLFSLVTLIIYSLVTFGFRGFKNSSDRSNKDIEVRTMIDLLTNELKYADAIQVSNISASDISSPVAGHHYVFLNSGTIYQKQGTNAKISFGTSSDYTMSFQILTDTLKFTVGKIGDSTFSLSSSVQGMNLKAGSITGASSGNCIDYTLPAAVVSASPTPTPAATPTSASTPSPTPTPVAMYGALSGDTGDKNQFTLTYNKNVSRVSFIVSGGYLVPDSYDINNKVVTVNYDAGAHNNDIICIKANNDDGTSVTYKAKWTSSHGGEWGIVP